MDTSFFGIMIKKEGVQMDIIGYIAIALLVLIFVLLGILLRMRSPKREQRIVGQEMELRTQRMMEDMSQRISKELLQFQNLLHQNMQSDLHTLRKDSTEQLFSMEKNMHESLNRQLETTGRVYTDMMQEMTKVNETQKHLEGLSYHIQDLQAILNDKKTRGIFGEIELYTLLEQVMGTNINRWNKQVKLSNGCIADCVLFGGEAMPVIAIDAKFPLENYRRLMDDSLNKVERKTAQQAFMQDVKKHIKTIADKYIIAHETADFAYMFLPAESLFAYLHESLPQVIQYAYEQHVYIVSPTTLMAYVTAIKAMYLNQKQSANMSQIQNELKKLAIEFERFEKRYTLVSSDFEKAYNDMRQVSITAQKLTRRFEMITNVELDEDTI